MIQRQFYVKISPVTNVKKYLHVPVIVWVIFYINAIEKKIAFTADEWL